MCHGAHFKPWSKGRRPAQQHQSSSRLLLNICSSWPMHLMPSPVPNGGKHLLVVSSPFINITLVSCIQSQFSICFFPTILKVERLTLHLLWHLQWQLHCRTSSSAVCLNVVQGKYLQLSILSQALCSLSTWQGLVLGQMAPANSCS